MSAKEINAQLKDGTRVVKVTYDFGDNLQDAVAKFGEEVVFSRFESAAVIDAQALIRRGIKAEKTDEEIASTLAAWKPGVKQVVRKSASEKIKDAFSGLTAEQKKEMLKALRDQMNSEKAA